MLLQIAIAAWLCARPLERTILDHAVALAQQIPSVRAVSHFNAMTASDSKRTSLERGADDTAAVTRTSSSAQHTRRVACGMGDYTPSRSPHR